jgi:glycosyltransferase involved in cell wall biosynthesis
MREVMKENGIGDLQVSVLPYFAPWKGEHWSDPENRNGILYVGRVNFGKGIFALIHALSKLEKATLDIVGDGPDREAVEEAIKKMGMERRVACHGWIRDKATLQGFYRRNAVVAVPSLWPEPFGIVGLEAGMCFRPSVAFDVGGISDWLKQERTGYLVEPGNLNALEHSLRSLLDDSDTGREMGREAHGFIGSTFSVETHLEQLQKLFDNVASR